jgi:hypothetical protein
LRDPLGIVAKDSFPGLTLKKNFLSSVRSSGGDAAMKILQGALM